MTKIDHKAKGLLVLFVVVLLRALLLPWYPLMDTTEARYGEMARLMVETGNWITPLFDYNVPFWGKPPLHTWMSASSIIAFGNNEFAVRFPHWLAAILVLVCVGYFALRLRIPVLPVLIILASTVVFTISAGAVMTDMALTLGLTMAMVGFYLCWQGDKPWGYAGFTGLAIGMLAKGPVTLVLFAIGSGLWLLWLLRLYSPIKIWQQLWLRIPLLSGLVLMLAIALPWYVIAEQTTPGFLNYFIFGEHWSRFVNSGWKGDLYGTAHDRVRGTIWLYFVIAALPWSLFLPKALYKIIKESNHPLSKDDLPKDLCSYLVCWMIAPMVLFTFAGNILPAYVLPGIPGLALLLGFAWRNTTLPKLHTIALSIPLLLIVTVIVLNLGPGKDKSERWILAQRDEPLPTYYWLEQPFSARFYSSGQADKIQSLNEVTSGTFYLVANNKLIKNEFSGCIPIANNKYRGLLKCHSN